MNKKLLIIVGGNKRKIEPFRDKALRLGMKVTLASFSEVNYCSFGRKQGRIMIGEEPIERFGLIYIRMIGKRLEDASLLVKEAQKNSIPVVDRLYQTELLLPSSVAKAVEMKKLIEAGIPLPRTVYGDVVYLKNNSADLLGYPYVIKSTSGRKARDTWLVTSENDETALFSELKKREIEGVKFFSQEFISASQRIRVLVVGDKVLGAVTRPTKWRKRIESDFRRRNPEGIKAALTDIPKEYIKLALNAVKAVNLDIGGVDILVKDDGGKPLIIEVNAAPAWQLVEKDCGVDVESEILKFLEHIFLTES